MVITYIFFNFFFIVRFFYLPLPCFMSRPIFMRFRFLFIHVKILYLIFPLILSPPYIRPIDCFLSVPSRLYPWLRQTHTIVRPPSPRFGFHFDATLSQISAPRATLYALIAPYSLNIPPLLFPFSFLPICET